MALSGGPRGRAFQDLNNNGVQDPGEPGLVGWTIHVFHTATKALVQSRLTMASEPGPPPTGDGLYFFVLDPGEYTICVALQDGWTQTAPVLPPSPPGAMSADCTSYTNGGIIEPAPRGYDVTIAGAEVHADLDFRLTFELTALGDVQLWLGLKSSEDQGTLFDVKVELLKNADRVASGLRHCVTGVTRNPRLAKGIGVAWDNFTAISLAPTDVLTLRISTRIGTNRDDTKCVPGPASAHANARGLRLYYDAASRPARFDAALASGANHSLYLDSDGTACPAGGADSSHVTDRTLTGAAPIAPDAKCKDSSDIKFPGGNPFREVGTWILP